MNFESHLLDSTGNIVPDLPYGKPVLLYQTLLELLALGCHEGFSSHSDQLFAMSHQTHSHYAFQNGLRTGCCQKILNWFKLLDVLAHSGRSYYVHVVRTTVSKFAHSLSLF